MNKKNKRAVNVPLTGKEYDKICQVSGSRGIGKATFIKLLLNDGITDFRRMSQSGIFIRFEMPEEMEKSVQVYVPEELYNELLRYSKQTNLPMKNIARQIIVPQMAGER